MLKLPTLLTTLNTPVKLLNPTINISQFDSVVRNGHIGLLAALFRLNITVKDYSHQHCHYINIEPPGMHLVPV